jgi:predicted RecB family nuclease
MAPISQALEPPTIPGRFTSPASCTPACRFYAAPDLLYRRGERWVIVEVKTGSEEDVVLQLALYALYLRDGMRERFREGVWQGRVVNLATGDDTWVELEREDLERAEERIDDSVRAMHELLADRERNVPLGIEAFPLAAEEQHHLCPSCPFFQMCGAELARARRPALTALLSSCA